METAPRTMRCGKAVLEPRPGHGDGADEEADQVVTPSAGAAAGSSPASGVSPRPSSVRRSSVAGPDAEPRPATARALSAVSPVRASSIIPSNKTRTETPRRPASASTHERRLWSSLRPRTVDFEVAMAALTLIPGVYGSGVERWQGGCESQGWGDRIAEVGTALSSPVESHRRALRRSSADVKLEHQDHAM